MTWQPALYRERHREQRLSRTAFIEAAIYLPFAAQVTVWQVTVCGGEFG
jgi:hypothetical protein